MTDLQIIYKASCDYLLKILPDDVSIEHLEDYFQGDNKDFSALQDVYEQLIRSAQNYQRMPNVIKFEQRRDELRKLLFELDFNIIKEKSAEELYFILKEAYKFKADNFKYNSWYKWSKSVVDAAKFMSEFEDIVDFNLFVERFSYNLHTRIALPLLIEKKISGIGFALACDSLKELGYLTYSKPDIHIKEVLYKVGVADNDDISAFETIDRMSEECKEIDAEVSAYKIDKVLWLICSGKFYKDNITIGQHKNKLIAYLREQLKKLD